MGAAEYVGDELAAKLESLDYPVVVHEQPDINDIPQQAACWLICTSTHGAGDLPDNIQHFFKCLSESKPSLSDIEYGIIGLGDKRYDTYCQAADELNRLLQSLGAQLKGELLKIDAQDEQLPEAYALDWLPRWLDALAH